MSKADRIERTRPYPGSPTVTPSTGSLARKTPETPVKPSPNEKTPQKPSKNPSRDYAGEWGKSSSPFLEKRENLATPEEYQKLASEGKVPLR